MPLLEEGRPSDPYGGPYGGLADIISAHFTVTACVIHCACPGMLLSSVGRGPCPDSHLAGLSDAAADEC